MTRKTRREMLAALGATTALGLAGCSGNGDGDSGGDGGDGGDGADTPTETPTEGTGEMTDTPTEGMGEMTDTTGTASVRVAHFSPNAPNVDVYLDGSAVLEDVPFRAVSGYLEVPAGPHTVGITAAGDPDTVAFEGEVTVEAADYTFAAVGNLGGDENAFEPLVLEDDNSGVGDDTARIRLVHASPDAPAVDVTASGSAVFDGVAFGETSTGTVPASDYTLGVRGDTESNDGDVVADFDVSLNGNTVYTAFAVGYLTPDDEPADEAFDLQVAQDASF
ncbi:MAG: DUF4397 domain-containing protein [Haloarculaceae archaeon]